MKGTGRRHTTWSVYQRIDETDEWHLVATVTSRAEAERLAATWRGWEYGCEAVIERGDTVPE